MRTNIERLALSVENRQGCSRVASRLCVSRNPDSTRSKGESRRLGTPDSPTCEPERGPPDDGPARRHRLGRSRFKKGEFLSQRLELFQRPLDLFDDACDGARGEPAAASEIRRRLPTASPATLRISCSANSCSLIGPCFRLGGTARRLDQQTKRRTPKRAGKRCLPACSYVRKYVDNAGGKGRSRLSLPRSQACGRG